MYRKYIFFRVIYICSKCMKTSMETTDTNVRILISPFLVLRGKDWGKVLAVLLKTDLSKYCKMSVCVKSGWWIYECTLYNFLLPIFWKFS